MNEHPFRDAADPDCDLRQALDDCKRVNARLDGVVQNLLGVIALTLLGGFVLFVGLVATSCAEERNKNLFQAERACNPGMVYEVVDERRAICIGGNEQLWHVQYR